MLSIWCLQLHPHNVSRLISKRSLPLLFTRLAEIPLTPPLETTPVNRFYLECVCRKKDLLLKHLLHFFNSFLWYLLREDCARLVFFWYKTLCFVSCITRRKKLFERRCSFSVQFYSLFVRLLSVFLGNGCNMGS